MASSEAIAVRSSDQGASHIAFMDGMRGIAVLMMLLYHLKIALGSDLHVHAGGVGLGINRFASAGFLGVEVFFFISGFVLFYPYARTIFENKPLQTVAHFANRRALKILPSYVFSLTFIVVLTFSSLPRPLGWPVTANLLHGYWLHLIFAHSLYRDTFFGISSPLWSLAVEVQFYLILPVLALAFRRWAMATPLVLIAIAETYRYYLQKHGDSYDIFQVYQMPGFLDLLAFGMVSSYLIVMFRARYPQLARWWPLFTLVSLLAAVGLNAMLFDLVKAGRGAWAWHWQNTYRLSLGAVLAIFAISGMLGAPLWQKLIANRVFVYLAFISYNLYLWHQLVIEQVAHHVLPFFRHWPFWNASKFVVPFAFAIFVAIAATYLIERPFLDHGWSVLHRRVPSKTRPKPEAASP